MKQVYVSSQPASESHYVTLRSEEVKRINKQLIQSHEKILQLHRQIEMMEARDHTEVSYLKHENALLEQNWELIRNENQELKIKLGFLKRENEDLRETRYQETRHSYRGIYKKSYIERVKRHRNYYGEEK